MPDHIGIDLGTTTSGLAWIKDDGTPEIVPNSDGERLTASVVYFDKFEKVMLVGSAARDGGDPGRTVFRIKDRMDDPNYFFEIDGKKWTPTEISAFILAKLRRDCANLIGPIEKAVITVPANFNELAREATLAAARIAGLEVTRLVNEPTAAALYYAYHENVRGRVLVYDLGGGTLDVTILEIEAEGSMRILTSEGARRLGGNDFDDILLTMYAEQVRDITKAELFTDDRERRRCLHAVEDAKKMLSKLRTVTDTVGNRQVGLARIELARDVFEEAVAGLLTRTVMLVEQALASACLEAGDIEHVVLVGGSTRIPKVREILERQFGFAPLSCGNVDECVAQGAALFSKHAQSVTEVCNQSYGILALLENPETGEQRVRNSVIIAKNSIIPCSRTQTYHTSEDNESIIEVDVTQGEDEDPRYVDILGRLTLSVPSGRPADCEVTVTYSYDENQRVRASVLDQLSGKSTDVAIDYRGLGVLSEKQIRRKSSLLKQIRVE